MMKMTVMQVCVRARLIVSHKHVNLQQRAEQSQLWRNRSDKYDNLQNLVISAINCYIREPEYCVPPSCYLTSIYSLCTPASVADHPLERAGGFWKLGEADGAPVQTLARHFC